MEYVIRIDERDFPALSAALGELPYKIAAPLVDKINRQIAAQDREAAKPDAPGGSGGE